MSFVDDDDDDDDEVGVFQNRAIIAFTADGDWVTVSAAARGDGSSGAGEDQGGGGARIGGKPIMCGGAVRAVAAQQAKAWLERAHGRALESAQMMLDGEKWAVCVQIIRHARTHSV